MAKRTVVLDETPETLRQRDDWPTLYPTSAVLVSCALPGERPNVLPVAGHAICSRHPFTAGIAICKQALTESYQPRYSHRLIVESAEFVINIPPAGQEDVITRCGSCSGRDVDKFAACGLTAVPAAVVQAPLIAECVVNLECQVTQIADLGSHDWIFGRVVAVHTDEEIARSLRWGWIPRPR